MIEYQPEPLFGPKSKVVFKWMLLGPPLLLILLYFTSLHSEPSPTYQPDTFTVTPQIAVLAQQAGIKLPDVVKAHAQVGTANCDANYFVACYDPSIKTVYLYPRAFTDPKANPASSLAYEMSHYYWQTMGLSGQNELKPLLDQYYSEHKGVIEATQKDLIRIEGGYGTSAFYDELHSMACTMTVDTELSPSLLSHCTKLFANRSVLESIY